MEAVQQTRDETKTRIANAAAQLLREGGSAAVTTRGVAQQAGVQAPTIYRLFGDKDGLLDAVAEKLMADYVSQKAETVSAATAAGTDPVEDLHAGWQRQVDFGLANPDVFRLLNDPARAGQSPAARAGREVLRSRVHRLAVAGRLRVGEELAVDMIQAAGTGTIQTLLAATVDERQPGLSADMFDAVLAKIVLHGPNDPASTGRGKSDQPSGEDGGAAKDRVRTAAVTLRAAVEKLDGFSVAERALIGEWLDRVIG